MNQHVTVTSRSTAPDIQAGATVEIKKQIEKLAENLIEKLEDTNRNLSLLNVSIVGAAKSSGKLAFALNLLTGAGVVVALLALGWAVYVQSLQVAPAVHVAPSALRSTLTP